MKESNHGVAQWPWSFGQTLKLIRVALRFTLDEAAAQTGRNQSYLSSIERDKVQPSGIFLADMAKVYGCPWWNHAQSVHWLHNLAWIYGNARVAGPTVEQADRLKTSLSRAMDIVAEIDEVVRQSHEITTQYTALMAQIGLLDVDQLPLQDHAPVWAWIVESVGLVEWASEEPNVRARVRYILAHTSEFFSRHAVQVDRSVVGLSMRAFREARQWSPADLAREASRQLQAAGEAGLQTTDIEALEQGSSAIDIPQWSAIAQALEVPLSQILQPPAVLRQQVTEADIVQLLRQYGLNDRAITVIRAMLSYIKGPPDEPTDPIP